MSWQDKVLDKSDRAENGEKCIESKVYRMAPIWLKDELDLEGEGEEMPRVTSRFLSRQSNGVIL